MSDNNGTVPAGEADQGWPSLRRTDSNLSWTPSQGGSQGSSQGSSQAMIYDLFLFTLVPVAMIFGASSVHSWRVFSRVQAMCRCLYVLSVDVLPTSMSACLSGSFQVLRIHSSCVVCLSAKIKKKTLFVGLQQEQGHQKGEAGQGKHKKHKKKKPLDKEKLFLVSMKTLMALFT
jgi:hypothetical protein